MMRPMVAGSFTVIVLLKDNAFSLESMQLNLYFL